MIVYYDVLLIDDQSLLSAKRSDRFLRLENLVTCVKGRSALVNHEVIDCGDRNAASRLRLAFAKCISAHREGLVLKPDDPYFDLSTTRRPYGSCCIKLKKEYIGSFGDVGDFAVVGARYDAAMAKSYQMPNIKWTHFYIGCLENRDEVQRWGLPPRFIVTNVVQLNPSQMRFFINHVNPPCLPATENERLLFRIAPGIDNGRSPSVVFTNPPVFDIRCFSFDRGGNTGFWSLRFPMVNKVHCDRSFQDTVSFSELQDIAEAEKKMPPPTDSQELLGLIAALEQAEPGARAVYLESQSTASRASTGMASPILSSPESQIAQPTSLLHELEPDSASTEQVLPILATYSTAMGPMTPPRSSAAVGCLGTEDSLRDVVTDDAGAVERSRKRAVEPAGTPRHPKMRKFATHPTRPAGGAVAGPSPRPGRTPLLDTEPNSQSQERPGTSQGRVQFSHTTSRETHEKELFFQRSVLDEDISVRTRQIVSTGAASQGFAFNTRSSRVPGRGDRGLSSHRAHECIYCPTTCQLRRMSILLSPCISKYAWITEDLLPAHGTMHVVSNAAAWKRAPFTSSSPNASKGGSSMVTQGDVLQSRMTKTLRRKKKVILVESRRKAATDQFLKEVEKVDLTLASGEREYVPVFDWRVLEVLTEVEARCSRGGERQDACFNKKEFEGIWKRHWVGLA
ncbi:hypothetical protein VTK73DRAFT_4085 [Phialemonium thermophilum]|uniref:ATP-dependent DNA ligase family profile domain-containing protein n=1 Tax=Phialemonium thermophilum TaxID=223376 RepID=A0ABR3WV74_9PEZI